MKKATKARERGARANVADTTKAWGLRTQRGKLTPWAFPSREQAMNAGWDGWNDGNEPDVVRVRIVPILRTAAGGKRR